MQIDNIFVISLKTAEQRRQHILKTCEEHQLKFEFFDAINLDTITDTVKKFELKITSQKLSQLEIACFLSHYCLWQKLITQNNDYMVIFEDDVHLSHDINQVFSKSDWLPQGFDLIKLETMYERVLIDTGKSINANHNICRMLSRHMGAAGYILSKQGAQKIVEWVENYGICVPPDYVTFDIFTNFENNLYQVSPALCIQDNILNKENITLQSSLQNTRGFQKQPKKNISIAQKIQRELYRILNSLKPKNLLYQYQLYKGNFSKTKITFLP